MCDSPLERGEGVCYKRGRKTNFILSIYFLLELHDTPRALKRGVHRAAQKEWHSCFEQH